MYVSRNQAQFLRLRSAGTVLTVGCDYGRAAVFQVPGQQLVNQVETILVEVGIGLIQQPQRRICNQQPSQGTALALAGGQRTGCLVSHARQPRSVQCRLELLLEVLWVYPALAIELPGKAQVFLGAEVILDRQCMSQVCRAIVTADFTGTGREYARQQTDESGLAAAVVAGDHQQLACRQAEAHRLENRLEIPFQAELRNSEQRAWVQVNASAWNSVEGQYPTRPEIRRLCYGLAAAKSMTRNAIYFLFARACLPCAACGPALFILYKLSGPG
jgi:hypothetical protein